MSKTNFIPARENSLVIAFFDWYTRILLKRRFRSVLVKQRYKPTAGARTVYFANHNYWWDGLLPLYLNRTRFNQKARALMEDTQMQQYPFFSRIGAFSINLSDPRGVIRSLRYAVESLKRPDSCLFIYPEGTLNPPGNEKPDFKRGLSWLYEQVPEADFVPFAIYIDHSSGSKPDLHIHIGDAIRKNIASKEQASTLFENEVHQLLKEIKADL